MRQSMVMAKGCNKKVLVTVLTVMSLVLLVGVAMAFMSPAVTTDPGYDLWNLIVNKFIKGPLGTAAGVVMLTAGAVGAAMGKLSGAVWPLVGGGVLVTAPSLAVSLGMLF